MTKYFLNGREIQDVVDASEDEATILERHWETGEIVREPDGSPRTLVLRGQVRVEGAAKLPCASDAVLRPAYCPVCGGDCPSADECVVFCLRTWPQSPYERMVSSTWLPKDA